MERQLTRADILSAKAIHLYNEDTIYVELNDTEDVYGSYKGGEWFVKTNFWDYWDSSIMLSYFRHLAPDEAFKLLDRWQTEREFDIEADNYSLNKAIIFATEKHSGQLRKSTAIPYILHPLEVLQILYSMRADTNLLIAGVLHDTVEDTDTTLDEIREIFGDDVAELVASNSEDKSKTWDERKQHTIIELAQADKRVKMLIMADKLSNLRSIAYDYSNIGDKLWNRFNAPKEKQAWYYDGISDSLYDMQLVPECEKLYWEFTGLFKDVFVKYYLDTENEIIWQMCDTGDYYYLKKDNPSWKNVADEINDNVLDGDGQHHYYKIDLIPENAKSLTRKDAEILEDIWNKPFWDCHNVDLHNMEYPLYSSKKRSVCIIIYNGTLTLCCNDLGKECESINGTNDYEFSYSLNEDATKRFLAQLRIKHGINVLLKDILKLEFGKSNGPQKFKDFCEKVDVPMQFYSR